MSEIWLKENDNSFIKFPVTPQTIEINSSSKIETININDLGEVGLFCGTNLKTSSISSFLPSSKYPFVKDFTKDKWEIVRILEAWKNRGQVLRYIVTGTNINFPMIISSFSYREQDGTRDIYFDLELIEYKEIKIPKKVLKPNENKPRPTPTQTSKQRTHKVKPGDSLWAIAQQYYGKGSLYTKIKEANWNKYPSLKTSNLIYAKGNKAMELVIP